MQDELEKYVCEHSAKEHPGLEWIRRQTHLRTSRSHMLSGPVQGALIQMIVRTTAARKVLEIGTFTGYSSACIALALPPDGHLDTLEKNDELISVIDEGWRRIGVRDRITLIQGPALETLGTLEGPYDLVYIDADKREYPQYFEAVLPLVRPGGLILADNTLWGGKIVQDPLPTDAQSRGVMAFNDMAAACDAVETVILPLRDGLTLIRKK